jgi:hypothetical protein
VIRALSRSQVRLEKLVCRREPKPRVPPYSFTGRMYGWRSTSHFGGVAVGVHITTFSPAAPSVSMARSSQAQSKRPGSGSSRDQANSAMRTKVMPT